MVLRGGPPLRPVGCVHYSVHPEVSVLLFVRVCHLLRIRSGHLEKYGRLFDGIWYASAFKGAERPAAQLPLATRYVLNQVSAHRRTQVSSRSCSRSCHSRRWHGSKCTRRSSSGRRPPRAAFAASRSPAGSGVFCRYSSYSYVNNALADASRLMPLRLSGFAHRFDHFATLCELLPAATPTLALCLAALANGLRCCMHLHVEPESTGFRFSTIN